LLGNCLLEETRTAQRRRERQIQAAARFLGIDAELLDIRTQVDIESVFRGVYRQKELIELAFPIRKRRSGAAYRVKAFKTGFLNSALTCGHASAPHRSVSTGRG